MFSELLMFALIELKRRAL